LTQVDLEGAQDAQLSISVYALGDQPAACSKREMPQAGNHRLTRVIGLEIGDQPPVQLHERRS
jgi:hypothetical protein